jgi:hypothetical protein
MAASKSYRVIWPGGLVGFNGVVHKKGDIIESDKVPAAHLKVWMRFKQVEPIANGDAAEVGDQKSEVSEKKGGKSK